MIAPSRRIWLYPDPSWSRAREIEIMIFGSRAEIVPLMVAVQATLDQWPGFEHVEVLGTADVPLGFRATRSKHAQHDDAVAEAMLMLGSTRMSAFRIQWSGNGWGSGMVGTW